MLSSKDTVYSVDSVSVVKQLTTELQMKDEMKGRALIETLSRHMPEGLKKTA
jgi:hypothetical protein